jgi:hypothetical protein
MTNRKPTLSLLYSNASSSGWARALGSLGALIDESLAPVCMAQWQRCRVHNGQAVKPTNTGAGMKRMRILRIT